MCIDPGRVAIEIYGKLETNTDDTMTLRKGFLKTKTIAAVCVSL